MSDQVKPKFVFPQLLKTREAGRCHVCDGPLLGDHERRGTPCDRCLEKEALAEERAEGFADGLAAGIAQEREAVVAWLLTKVVGWTNHGTEEDPRVTRPVADQYAAQWATEIERGEHRKGGE